MSYASDLYTDIASVLDPQVSMVRRYQRLRRVMDRMLKERTSQDDVEYCGIIPRLHALGRTYPALPLKPLSVLWSNALMVIRGELAPDEEDFCYDLKAICQGITVLYKEIPPRPISKLLPDHWRALERRPAEGPEIPQLRVVADSWDDTHIEATSVDDGESVNISIDKDGPWRSLPSQLYEGAVLNLLSLRGTQAELIVLDPDYLIDITALCSCANPSAVITPLHFLTKKLMPDSINVNLQMGNVANQFLDDLVNAPDVAPEQLNETYSESLKKSFRASPLTYCVLPDINLDFFKQCERQFANLYRVTTRAFQQAGIDLQHGGVQLEPSFLSEALGLQGRLDLLTSDLQHIVELKSGKMDEYHNTFQHAHALQMALYKEILHRNLGKARGDVQTLLLYSKYPKMFDIRLGQDALAQAIALRNGIVHIERILRSDNALEFLKNLTLDDFNPDHVSGKYYDYIKKNIEQFLEIIQNASQLELKYFVRMLTFTQREQFLAKVGDDRPDSDHGFAQTWLNSTREKLAAGNIIIDLHLTPICDENGLIVQLRADMPHDGEEQMQPNFREGDMVTLYERNCEQDLMTNRQILRCNIEEMHPDWLMLRLANPQRNEIWLHRNSTYAIEPGHMDATFSSQYRGLFALLSAPEERRQLILGERLPERDETIQLTREITNPETREIVKQAMQAQDYYLLVGPPGTGKTSIALSNMVQELLASKPQENILLMAYTNRAVDEICEMLEQLPEIPDYVRIGQELTCGEKYRNRLMRNIIAPCKNRREIFNRLAPVKVFCGTVSTLCGQHELFQMKRFGTALLDEASQVLEPQIMPLLCETVEIGGQNVVAIKRFIFIGDHKQLPAVVTQHPTQSAVNDEMLNGIGLLNCRDSLFERLHRLALKNDLPWLIGMLCHQGRMHPAVSEFVNQRYYGGLLDIVPLKHQLGELDWQHYDSHDPWQSYLATHRTGFIHVEAPLGSDDNNKVNAPEARMVACMVAVLHQLHGLNGMPWEPSKRIGIIVPFRGQITMIRQQMEQLGIPQCGEITIDTVERYQGSQRDIILFSTVIRQRYQLDMLSTPVESEGTLIDRKLNVAVTRARKQFFLIGNRNLLSQSPDYAELMNSLNSQRPSQK